MKKTCVSLLVVFVLLPLLAFTVLAQEEGLKLTMSRDWGYGGFNNEIQGLFSMHVKGPENLIKVEFYIDEMKIGEDTEPPFALQFTTDTYPLGLHSMHAIGTTTDNQVLNSNVIQANFVAASEGTDAAIKIIG